MQLLDAITHYHSLLDEAGARDTFAQLDAAIRARGMLVGKPPDRLICSVLRPRLLTEAQLAGCPVIGPAYGARDAYLDGVTGATPADESPEALAAVLVDLLADRARLGQMRQRCAEWARMATEPEEHIRSVFSAVLGIPGLPPRPAQPRQAPSGQSASPASPAAGTSPPPVPAQAAPPASRSARPAARTSRRK